MEGVEVVARGGVAEHDLAALVIHADAHFPGTDREILAGAGRGERLALRARDAQRPKATQGLYLQHALPRHWLRGHAHHAAPAPGPLELRLPGLAAGAEAWQAQDTAERIEALGVGGLSADALKNRRQRHCLQILGNDEIWVSRGRIQGQ